MNNSETIVKVRTDLLNIINSSGLSAVELHYIVGPIYEEIAGILKQQEQAAVDKINAINAPADEDEGLTEDDVEGTVDEVEELLND